MFSELAMLDGKAVHEDRLREAERARRFLLSQSVSRLPRLVKSVLLLFV